MKYLPKSLQEFSVALRYLCGSAFPEIRPSVRSTPADERYRQRRQQILRRLLCRCPWWIEGHLNLGLLQIEIAEAGILAGRLSEADRHQILETLSVSAAAVEELTRGRQAQPPAELLEARYLRAIERYLSADLEAAFQQLGQLLAPQFQHQLRRKIWLQMYEYAGYAAMTVRDIRTAAELFSNIPKDSRSGEVNRLLASAQAISAP